MTPAPSLLAQLHLNLALESVNTQAHAPVESSPEPRTSWVPLPEPPPFYATPTTPSAPTTPAARRDANDASLELARRLTNAGRLPDSLERGELAKFSGEGGLGHLSAYFTPPDVVRSVWKLLIRAGFKGGRTLEPSLGMGRFAESMPPEVKLTGIELDPDSALIARLLHPEVEVIQGSFEAFTTTSDGPLFDAAIGNPPYGARGETRSLHKREIKDAESYFALAVLERLRPGGLCALLLPAGMMQNASSREFRIQVLCLADLRLCARLPLETFANTGAHVTVDVWLLERRALGVGEALWARYGLEGHGALTQCGVARSDVESGHYICRPEDGVALAGVHPERALGEIGLSPRYGQATVFGTLSEALQTLETLPLDAATSLTLDEVLDSTPAEHRAAVQSACSQTYPIADGTRGPGGLSVMHSGRWKNLKELESASFKAALELSRALQTHRESRDLLSPLERKLRQTGLARRVRAFVDAHGDPHENALIRRNLRALSSLSHLLSAYTQGKLSHDLQPDDSSQQRILDLERATQTLARAANLSVETLAHLSDTSLAVAEDYLFRSGLPYDGIAFFTESHYYWGEAYPEIERLERLIENAHGREELALRRTVTGWKSRLDPWPLEKIYFTPRSAFVPLELLEAWLTDHWDCRIEGRILLKVQSHGPLKRITLESSHGSSEHRALSEAVSAREAMQKYLNFKTPVRKVSEKGDLSEAEYQGARQQAIEDAVKLEEGLTQTFRAWVESDPQASRALQDAYNQTFRGFIPPEDDEGPLSLTSWSGPRLHPYQARVVRRLFRMRRGVAGLKVGLGKTYLALALAAMCKEAGQTKRPVITLPKSLLMNWAKYASSALACSTLLIIGASLVAGVWREDSRATVLKKLAQIPSQEWDLIVMSRSTFERIPMAREVRIKLIENDFQLQRQNHLASLTSRKQAKSASEWLETQLLKVKSTAEGELGFESLGIDLIIHDEVHGFKNLYRLPETLGGRPKFMGAGSESNRAMDAHHKGQWVGARGGRIYGLTGTPAKNSPLELFNLMTLMGENLAALGLPGGEDFLERYCELEPRIVTEKDGSVRSALAMVGFKNLTELRGVLARNLTLVNFEDARLEDGSLLHVPEVTTMEHTFDLHPEVMAAYTRERRQAMQAKRFDKAGDHLFSYFARMQKLTLDPGILSAKLSHLPNERFSKAAELCRNALEGGGKVLAFMDMGGEDDLQGSDAYGRLQAALVDAGINPNLIKIATAHTLPTSVSRGKLEDDYNAGRVRVILGSTGTIGEGLNLQVGTTDLIHLDTPWDPGTFEQRQGRGVRQGNAQSTVHEHLLLARGSFDALTFTTLSGKKSWLDILFDPNIEQARSHGAGPDLEEIALLLSDDPEATRAALQVLRGDALAGQESARAKGMLRRITHWGRTRDQWSQARARSKNRVRGPTANDLRQIAWLEAAELKTRAALEGDPDFAPYRDLLEVRAFCEHPSELPLHVGLTLTLKTLGGEEDWTVLDFEERKSVTLVRERENLRYEWRDPLPWTAWKPRANC